MRCPGKQLTACFARVRGLADPVFTRRFEVLLDERTFERITRLARDSSPPRGRTEMVRHLLRLGLRTYDPLQSTPKEANDVHA